MREWKRLHRPGWYERTGWLAWRVEVAAVVPWWLGVLRPESSVISTCNVVYTVRGLNVPARLGLALWCWLRRPWRRLDGYYRESWLVHRVLELERELRMLRHEHERLERGLQDILAEGREEARGSDPSPGERERELEW